MDSRYCNMLRLVTMMRSIDEFTSISTRMWMGILERVDVIEK